MSEGNGLTVYLPRQPQQSPLWKMLDKHYATFEREFEQKYQKTYGCRRAAVDDVVRDYLKCGDLREEFARVRCPDCCCEFLLSFSCKGRWFCPSCHAKKVVQFGDLLGNTILSPLPHRQYVFTLPKILRVYFRYDRKLLTKLCRCANRSLLRFFKTALNTKSGQFGTVTAIQTFGDYGRWHLHLLVADGLFMPNGSFHAMPDVGLKPLQELFRASVLKMLKKEGKVDDEFIRMVMRWRRKPLKANSYHLSIQAAKTFNIRHVNGQTVSVSLYHPLRDCYGRLHAYVYLTDGRLLNSMLLEQGLAVVYRKYDFRLKEEFLAAEEQAKQAGVGLWEWEKP